MMPLPPLLRLIGLSPVAPPLVVLLGARLRGGRRVCGPRPLPRRLRRSSEADAGDAVQVLQRHRRVLDHSQQFEVVGGFLLVQGPHAPVAAKIAVVEGLLRLRLRRLPRVRGPSDDQRLVQLVRRRAVPASSVLAAAPSGGSGHRAEVLGLRLRTRGCQSLARRLISGARRLGRASVAGSLLEWSVLHHHPPARLRGSGFLCHPRKAASFACRAFALAFAACPLHNERVIQIAAFAGTFASTFAGTSALNYARVLQVSASRLASAGFAHCIGQRGHPRVLQDLVQRRSSPSVALQEAVHKLDWTLGHGARRHLGPCSTNQLDSLFLRGCGERRPRHEHLKKQHAEGPQIHARVVRLVQPHLRGEVVQGAAEGLSVWPLGRELHAPAEVAQLGAEVRAEEEDVLGLDVSVGHALPMQIGQAVRGIREEMSCTRLRQTCDVIAEKGKKLSLVSILQKAVDFGSILEVIMHSHDVRMVGLQLCQDLTLELLLKPSLANAALLQHLHGKALTCAMLHHQVHKTERANAQLPYRLEVRQRIGFLGFVDRRR
mmetsp:Transcript_102714/g.258781  ORF Transcript_102714/g.258781 Transcript_102714/m.258781 type:complete len:546 (+) Transcript_102714:3366-5003(+)